ncbi:Eukaryotic translation initiation factor 2 beta subunit [Spironucleus salmonicida]|uniref:Eukaryotic translation initiation factor 2 beta subunit n=1 Tax=Spironucleus salmonicida TaxID=348837 RepID=V6LW66_9EUKA|nr:Eukaryotic translation initiation factor 2 beta subunit [Spironucleus salmonicida]|eukprot:EST48872.1 Eukaryotic translation initiation factor 2 beta subunit [Spironucleus salmonicida]
MFDSTIKKQTTVKKVVKKIAKKQSAPNIYDKTQIGKLIILTPKEDSTAILQSLQERAIARRTAAPTPAASDFSSLPKHLNAPAEEVALLWPLKAAIQSQGTDQQAETSYKALLAALRAALNTGHVHQAEITPETQKIGSLRTKITNFQAICDSLNRAKEVVSKFISHQFECDCAVNDTDGALLIKKRLPNDQIVGIIRRFKSEFVQCVSCGSLNTIISKNEGLRDQLLSCEECQAQRHIK